MSLNTGIIGLGSMGTPIARRLLRGGHQVTGYNRTRARAESLEREGLRVAETPAAATQVDILISVLSDDSAVEGILLPQGRLLTAARAGLVHVCMSTISERLADRLAESHAAAAQHYVSAPLFGPPEAAQSGKLFIAAAGPTAAIERLRPLFSLLGRLDVIGERPAAANVVKIAGNLLMAAAVESLREAIGLVTSADASPTQFVGLITQALFPTPVYQYIGGSIASRAQTGGLDMSNPFERSAELALATAADAGLDLPLTRSIVHARRDR